MSETIQLRLNDEQNTKYAGAALAQSIYGTPVTIALVGDLGAGKTTFLQGFGEALGIDQTIVSPTYALEQRLQTEHFGECIHIDLYRLTPDQAVELLQSSEEATGIRCIEWANRVSKDAINADIEIELEEDATPGRKMACTFHDVKLPSSLQIETWRKEMMLPEHICRHCDAVAAYTETLAQDLLGRGIPIRKEAVTCAAMLHDLLRFIDFTPGGSHVDTEDSPEELACWKQWTQKYPSMSHEQACAAFLREQRYTALGDIVEYHGISLPFPAYHTVEQKLLFYADKRILLDRKVCLEERKADFYARYAKDQDPTVDPPWLCKAKEIEAELQITDSKEQAPRRSPTVRPLDQRP